MAVEQYFHLCDYYVDCLCGIFYGRLCTGKKRFYGQATLFSIFVFAMALPKQVILVPLMKLVSFMGIHDTPWAIIVPLCGWPFGVFLMKQFSENIPTELLEAAKIDGSGEILTFSNIVMPIVKPWFWSFGNFLLLSIPGMIILCSWLCLIPGLS